MKPAAVVVLVFALGCEAAGPAVVRDKVVVSRGSVAPRVLITGELDAVVSRDVSVPATPAYQLQIQWIVEDGTEVKQGDRVVDFDNSQLIATVSEKELAVLRADGDLGAQEAQSRIDVANKKFALLEARIGLDKAKVDAAVPADTVPARTYQEHQLALTRAQSSYDRAKDDYETQVRAAQLDREVKSLALEKAERDYSDTVQAMTKLTLRAPVDGMAVVSHNWREGRRYQVGDTLWPGQDVVKFPELRAMKVVANLPDVDDGKIHDGQKVVCRIDAYPDRDLPGRIQALSPVARELRNSPSRRAIEVVIELGETDPAIMRPGMSVLVEAVTEPRAETLVVDRRALNWGEGEPTRAQVSRVSGGEATVELGVCDAQHCEIVGGAALGDELWVGGGG